MLLVCTVVTASSAATPSWYPQLKLAVHDAGDAGAAISACPVPHGTTPKAGRVCAITGASDESGVFNRVSVYAETGAVVGPCRRLLLKLDHTTTTASAEALSFATHPKTTMAKDVSGRRELEQDATHVSSAFTALQHCLGKA
jgi:hypothetical protein